MYSVYPINYKGGICGESCFKGTFEECEKYLDENVDNLYDELDLSNEEGFIISNDENEKDIYQYC